MSGSREALAGALGATAAELLRTGVSALAITANPGGDLVEAALAFRGLARTHPALVGVAFRGVDPGAMAAVPCRDRRRAADPHNNGSSTSPDTAFLGRRYISEAVAAFDAREGMATLELHSLLASELGQDQLWRDSVT